MSTDLMSELADYLVGVNGPGTLTLGSTLQKGAIPQNEPDFCTAVLDDVPAVVDGVWPSQRQKPIHLLTRALTQTAARDEAHRIFNFLNRLCGIQLPHWWIYSVTGNEPALIGKDAKLRFVFSTNLILRARKE